MDIIKRSEAPVFSTPGASFTGYAAPSRGSSQMSMWTVELEPGSSGGLHQMDCEEVFLGLEGSAVAVVDGEEHALEAGDCLILPAGTPFRLTVPGDEPFRALACIPVGGTATLLPEGATIAPPWAA